MSCRGKTTFSNMGTIHFWWKIVFLKLLSGNFINKLWNIHSYQLLWAQKQQCWNEVAGNIYFALLGVSILSCGHVSGSYGPHNAPELKGEDPWCKAWFMLFFSSNICLLSLGQHCDFESQGIKGYSNWR